MNPLEKRWLCAAGMVAPSIPVGWLSVAGQMAQQSPEYSDNSPVDDITTENDSVSGNPQDSLEGQVSKYIHLVMTAGQTVLEEMEE